MVGLGVFISKNIALFIASMKGTSGRMSAKLVPNVIPFHAV